LHARIGDEVKRGQPLATIHAGDATRSKQASDLLREAISISATHVEPSPLILERISER
jgi:thymidine phosphorylase